MKNASTILALLFLLGLVSSIGCGTGSSSDQPATQTSDSEPAVDPNRQGPGHLTRDELKKNEGSKTAPRLWQLKFLSTDEDLLKAKLLEFNIKLQPSHGENSFPARMLPDFAEADLGWKTLLGSEEVLSKAFEALRLFNDGKNRKKIYNGKFKMADGLFLNSGLRTAKEVIGLGFLADDQRELSAYHRALVLNNKSRKMALFLADAGGRSEVFDDVSSFSLATMLQVHSFSKESGVRLFKTDHELSYPDYVPNYTFSQASDPASIQPEDNLWQAKVDLTQDFPFGEQVKFDVIVLRNGLCLCNDSLVTCGGIDCSVREDLNEDHQIRVEFKKSPMKDLILKVAGQLNLENKDSFALLHGPGIKSIRHGNGSPKRVKFWFEIAAECEKEFNQIPENGRIKIQVVTDHNGSFYALLIEPTLIEG